LQSQACAGPRKDAPHKLFLALAWQQQRLEGRLREQRMQCAGEDLRKPRDPALLPVAAPDDHALR